MPQRLDVLENLGHEVQVCSPNLLSRTKGRTITPYQCQKPSNIKGTEDNKKIIHEGLLWIVLFIAHYAGPAQTSTSEHETSLPYNMLKVAIIKYCLVVALQTLLILP